MSLQEWSGGLCENGASTWDGTCGWPERSGRGSATPMATNLTVHVVTAHAEVQDVGHIEKKIVPKPICLGPCFVGVNATHAGYMPYNWHMDSLMFFHVPFKGQWVHVILGNLCLLQA